MTECTHSQWRKFLSNVKLVALHVNLFAVIIIIIVVVMNYLKFYLYLFTNDARNNISIRHIRRTLPAFHETRMTSCTRFTFADLRTSEEKNRISSFFIQFSSPNRIMAIHAILNVLSHPKWSTENWVHLFSLFLIHACDSFRCYLGLLLFIAVLSWSQRLMAFTFPNNRLSKLEFWPAVKRVINEIKYKFKISLEYSCNNKIYSMAEIVWFFFCSHG